MKNLSSESHIAVIDTETNWYDRIMSIGIVIADAATYEPLVYKYYVLEKEALRGGMFEAALFLSGLAMEPEITRHDAMTSVSDFLLAHDVCGIFAYNAVFDCGHMPELSSFHWYDIMRLAAYRQYNAVIPPYAECCNTGRLKRGYGVEPMYRLLANNPDYFETHNALYDALDELKIMQMLGHPIDTYEKTLING